MLHPDHLPGRANRDFRARPSQAWGRTGQGYGNTGPVKTELWADRKPSCEAVQSAPLWHFAACAVALIVLFYALFKWVL
jgi:hypothetical protein